MDQTPNMFPNLVAKNYYFDQSNITTIKRAWFANMNSYEHDLPTLNSFDPLGTYHSVLWHARSGIHHAMTREETKTSWKIYFTMLKKQLCNKFVKKINIYLSKSLNLPSTIAGTCPMGFISEKNIESVHFLV